MGVKSVALGLREGVFLSGVVPLWQTFFNFDASRVEMWAQYLCRKGTS